MLQTTIQQLLQSTRNKIDRLDAELLLAHALGKSREFVLANLEMKIERLKDYKIKRLFKKRAKGIPLAYLTGHKEFFGLDFFVNKHVLIPRPDTESLVEEALSSINNHSPDNKYQITDNRRITLIDVGTGSGCIPISIAKHIRKSGLSGYLDNIFAIDISRRALTVAKKNAKKHHVKASLGSAHVAGKIKFLHGNLLSPILKSYELGTKNYELIITANLPYLTNEQFIEEPSIHHEPKLALVAEESGLSLYHQLLKQIQLLVTNYQLPVTCFFEIDPSQSQKIKSLIKNHLPTAKIQIKQDLAGLDRVVIIENS